MQVITQRVHPIMTDAYEPATWQKALEDFLKVADVDSSMGPYMNAHAVYSTVRNLGEYLGEYLELRSASSLEI